MWSLRKSQLNSDIYEARCGSMWKSPHFSHGRGRRFNPCIAHHSTFRTRYRRQNKNPDLRSGRESFFVRGRVSGEGGKLVPALSRPVLDRNQLSRLRWRTGRARPRTDRQTCATSPPPLFPAGLPLVEDRVATNPRACNSSGAGNRWRRLPRDGTISSTAAEPEPRKRNGAYRRLEERSQ